MRQILILLFSLLTLNSFSQRKDTASANNESKRVRFITKIDILYETKDGIYLNGYVVNIPRHQIQALNGKTVRISGKVTLVKGTSHFTGDEKRQGRHEDTRHILKPKIKIIGD
ncbi:MAG TPA: hypothetical protein VGC29_11235 [Flavisolibacter sp.]